MKKFVALLMAGILTLSTASFVFADTSSMGGQSDTGIRFIDFDPGPGIVDPIDPDVIDPTDPDYEYARQWGLQPLSLHFHNRDVDTANPFVYRSSYRDMAGGTPPQTLIDNRNWTPVGPNGWDNRLGMIVNTNYPDWSVSARVVTPGTLANNGFNTTAMDGFRLRLNVVRFFNAGELDASTLNLDGSVNIPSGQTTTITPNTLVRGNGVQMVDSTTLGGTVTAAQNPSYITIPHSNLGDLGAGSVDIMTGKNGVSGIEFEGFLTVPNASQDYSIRQNMEHTAHIIWTFGVPAP